MKNTSSDLHIPRESYSPPSHRHRVASRVFKWAVISLGSLLGLVVLLLVGATYWLTPSRLAGIASRQASKYLEADVEVESIDFTFWSSFPRLSVKTGPIRVNSRTLDSLPDSLRRKLPDDARFLGSLHGFEGEINVPGILANRYKIHNVKVDSLRLNLVALNDSVNNYDIIPPINAGFKRVPYFSADTVRLEHTGKITYFSEASQTDASMLIEALSVVRNDAGKSHQIDGDPKDKKVNASDRKKNPKRKGDLYVMKFSGNVSLNADGLELLSRFPFLLHGNVGIAFNPFEVRLRDYGIELGNLRSTLNMSLGAGENARLDEFNYEIQRVNLLGLMGYFPSALLPAVESLTGNIDVSASASLTSPWHLSSSALPSLEVDFAVAPGSVDYKFASGNRIIPGSLSHSGVKAFLAFNGNEPTESRFTILPFEVEGFGTVLGFAAEVSDLTASPLVEGQLSLNAPDLRAVCRKLPIKMPLKISGSGRSHTDFRLRLKEFSSQALAEGLKDLHAEGSVVLNGLAVETPVKNSSGNFSADNITITTSEGADAFDFTNLVAPHASVEVKGKGLKGHFQGNDFSLATLHFKARESLKGNVEMAKIATLLPLNFNISAENLEVSPLDQSQIKVDCLRLASGKVKGNRRGGALANARIGGSAGNLTLAAPDGDYILEDLKFSLGGDFRRLGEVFARKPSKRALQQLPPTDSQDMLPPHTPRMLEVPMPERLAKWWRKADFNLDFTLGSGLQKDARGRFTGNSVSGISLHVTPDSLTFSNAGADIARTRGRCSLAVSRLRDFLTRQPSESNPLNVDFQIALDTVDINRLAKMYVDSKGGMANIPTHPATTSDDSIALLLPSNIRASIAASAKETVYTNLHLYDLYTTMNLEDGRLDLPQLHISSDFGHAAMNVVYDTRDIRNMNFHVGADLEQINIVNFFKNFHTLLLMMPQMKNISGMISAEATMKGTVFPEMYLNVPSLAADVTVQGRDLTVHQNKFIRHITRMMLIRNSGDIHIKNMNVHAAVRDNLLQLYPFNFEFDRYKLRMLGVNNFNGDLAYHIGVWKSPVPFPFGINIEGEFHDPKISFGGPRYNVKRGSEITCNIDENNDLNIVAMLKRFLREFIEKAAESAGEE